VAAEKRRISVVEKLLRFLLAGLPSFLFALPLNYLLVEYAQLNKAIAYGIVLLCQVVVNFFVCYWFVFERTSDRPLFQQFWQFVLGIMAFRCGDWAVYSLATRYLPIHYLIIQVTNVVIFSLLKFAFARRVMEASSSHDAAVVNKQ